jgi:hypothetical protein
MITLYIKTHLVTGLKYFGKTEKRDIYRYKGSGKRWLRHLAVHGNHVHTEIAAQFEDIDKATEFGIKFSMENNIVESPEWANLIVECGIGGANFGSTLNDPLGIVREKISDASTKMWQNEEKRNRIVATHKKRWTPELKEKNSVMMKGLWTDERKQAQSRLSKRLAAEGKISAAPILIPKTVAHKKAIAAALKGKEKSLEHRLNLSWMRIGGADGFTNYLDYAKYCYERYHIGISGPMIARDTNTGNTAVYKAIKWWPELSTSYLLKKSDE